MKLNFINTLLLLLAALAFYSCSSSVLIEKNLLPADAKNGFSKPRFVEGELIVTVKNIEVLKGDSLKQWNIDHNIPADEPPTLMLWSSKVEDHTNQRNAKTIGISPEPTSDYIEDENGNEIYFWNLSDKLKSADSIVIKRRFSYVDYDYKPDIDKKAVEEEWGSIPEELKTFYTKSEPFLEQTEEIKKTASEIIGEKANPFDKAKAVFNWVRANMKYVYPPEKRGAPAALKTLKGDCGQYSNLFIALARAAGIPARQQSGFVFYPGNIGYHVWSEMYLPVYGWVPVDCTKPDGFCHIDNQRLISSVGMNFKIQDAPAWATYKNSEINKGRVDFLQLVAAAMSGVKADINTDRIIIKSTEPE